MLKLNNKGFAISGILYATLILFLILMLGTLSILASGKFLLDKTKNNLVSKLNYEDYIEIFLDYTEIKVGKDYSNMPSLLEGVTLTDYYGNKLAGEIDYDTNLNIAVPGTYQVTYTATSGNKTVEAIRTIIVENPITPHNFSYTGSVQPFNVTKSGTYKLEVWGAQGGGASSTGGKGGYSVGEINLSINDILYVYVGQQGASSGTSIAAFGGGGVVGTSYPNAAQGGGASDIRIGVDNLYSRVIVAGGGGGAHRDTSTLNWVAGGYGGGITAGTGSTTTSGAGGAGGTQTAGGVGRSTGSWGQGGGVSGYDDGSGGGGWYGGGMGSSSAGQTGGGGSGYVYTSSTVSQYPNGCLLTGNYYLSAASTIAGNAEMPNPSGGTMIGKTGHGYVRITPLILKY